MTIKSDRWIQAKVADTGMISPFVPTQVRDGVISYGLSSYGYDFRVAPEYRIFSPLSGAIVDPKAFPIATLRDVTGPYCDIPGNSFALARSVEWLRIPPDVMCIVLGKSSYARCAVIINVTPLEPGWEGHITIEISNTSPLPARIYSNEGIGQILFFQSDEPCAVSYAARSGKYQQQQGITLPRM